MSVKFQESALVSGRLLSLLSPDNVLFKPPTTWMAMVVEGKDFGKQAGRSFSHSHACLVYTSVREEDGDPQTPSPLVPGTHKDY